MADTRIEWATKTWNPTTGCSEVSEGCDHCYASSLASKFQHEGNPRYRNGFELTMHWDKIDQPIWIPEPSRIFVNSMSDLFHPEVTDDFLKNLWPTMLTVDRHQYLILTKRIGLAAHKITKLGLELPEHIWIGTSVETQRWADDRIPKLIEIPARVKFLSCEPLLGPVDLSQWLLPEPQIDWVIVGGESQPSARPMNLDWARHIRDQCVAAQVPLFLKQLGGFPDKRAENKAILDNRRWIEYPSTSG